MCVVVAVLVAHMVLEKLIGIDHPPLNNVDQVSLSSSLPEGKSISRSFFFGRWTDHSFGHQLMLRIMLKKAFFFWLKKLWLFHLIL